MAYADGKNPDLRVSDAERDTVVTGLGQHFQDGRLDQEEFGDRVTAAMAARTRGDLDAVLTDLPPAAVAGLPGQAGQPDRRAGRPRLLAVLPVILVAALIAVAVGGGWHDGGRDGWPFAPFGLLWLIVPVLVLRMRIRPGRRRQWR